MWPSGDESLFAARGKHLCCRLHKSDQFCNQGIFQDFEHGVWTNPWGPLLFPPLSFPPFSSSHSPRFPVSSPPLKVGPLNSAKRSESVLQAPPAGSKLNLVHFSLKIWHLIATNLKISLRIKGLNFMQNFQILWMLLKHVNSTKCWIAIASKIVTGQYGFSTVLQQVNDQSDQQCKFLGVHNALRWVVEHWQFGVWSRDWGSVGVLKILLYVMQTPIRQKRSNFTITYFLPSKCRPWTVPPGAHAPSPPSHRHWCDLSDNINYCFTLRASDGA